MGWVDSRVLSLLVTSCVLPWACVLDQGSDEGAPDTGAMEATAGAAEQGDDTAGASCYQLPQCDPLAPSCPATGKCIPTGNAFECVDAPDGGEQLDEGEPCGGGPSCAEGLACLAVSLPGCVGAAGCCVAICDLDAPQCSAGTTCNPFFTGATLCYADVGGCTVG